MQRQVGVGADVIEMTKTNVLPWFGQKDGLESGRMVNRVATIQYISKVEGERR